ncbi:unnamed protein product [Rotaria sp. Silwood2]|nr:unnamed protein product [Rotaria sp. Silwood2]CAF2630953.1 unnamed protein product [Rotaria sp. Silwood2]CAF2923225.1 unnamed protein product [Rotaria sp. Silwood2]CAF3069738.1 unnamed protein product [Rotaria sp. Silwood2]CAF3907354.1 unnamed protein product [Rotaria sp. Silwood2]
MADAVAAAYPNVTSSGNPEQQFVQHQYAYQAQVSGGGDQFYNGAGAVDAQQLPEGVEQQLPLGQGQDANYSQYSRSGNDLAAGAGFVDPNNPGIIQQYAGAAGQLAQQGPNGYKINFDPNPQIIRKHANDAVTYKQEVAVRYLRPPTPPPPGPLIIKEVRNPALPAAPPIVIRQRPPRPATPPPLIIRERPPQPPPQLAPKVVTKPLPAPPPPPRRVIIERMPPLPAKPQSIIVERWLPYKQQKRRVVYQKAPPVQQPAPQKNLIIQWEGTQARVVKEFRNLGIIKADPTTYVQQYGPQLRPTQGLPDFIKGLPTPNLGPEYMAGMNPDQVDPSLVSGVGGSLGGQLGGSVGGFDMGGGQGLLAAAPEAALPLGGQPGFVQDNLQYASFGNVAGQGSGDQQNSYAYQQTVYSQGSTVEGQQYAADQQQGFEQQGQKGSGFVQNVQYQAMPQYGVSS